MCGNCCRFYSVVIDFPEWLQIVRCFGVEKTSAGLNRFYIKRCNNGCCPFLYNFSDFYLCKIQGMKPGACKQWPFKVLSEPKFGDPNHALYNYGGLRLFVYADSVCSGLRYGTPRRDFAALTLREFVEISLGKRQNQSKTTCFLRPF